jgi:hypothetical protein
MADATPSLGELTHIPADPNLGGGTSVPIIDNSHVVDQLNQNARFHAENTWRKYQTFLQNKTDLFKDVANIQQYDTLAEDKPALQKQAGDILGDILKDPTIATGGKGYGELQAKIAKFRGDSMLSKQNNIDTSADKSFLERNPDLQTDENMKAVGDYRGVPLGQRKSVLLQMPTLLDEKGLFEGALKSATHTTSNPTGDGYIVQNKVVSPDAIQGNMGMALKSAKDKYNHSISKAVETNFNHLPEDEKNTFTELAKQNKTTPVEEYWKKHTNDYLGAYIPDANYKKDKDGNYIIDTKTVADPNFRAQERLDLDKQKLSQKTENDRGNLSLKWAKLGVEKDKLNRAKTEDLGSADNVIDEVSDMINNGTPVQTYNTATGKGESSIRINDPSILSKFSQLNPGGNAGPLSAINFNPENNQFDLIYGSTNSAGGLGTTASPTKTIPVNQRTVAKLIAARSFPNKNIGVVNSLVNDVINSNGNSIYKVAQRRKENQQQSEDTPPKPVTSAKPEKKSKDVYVEQKVVNGVKWGRKADGTIEKVK